MDEFLIAGIAPSSDTTQIEDALNKHGLDMARISIVTKAKAQAKTIDEHHAGGMTNAATIMTGSGGTGVPGMGGGRASLSSFSGGGSAPDYLGGLPLISFDQAQHYNIAISEGRALITYKATPDEAPAVENAFRDAGLRNIKTFKPKETSRSG